jgi:hypothetical protein
MPTPTLRPLTTGELLDRTFSLYRSHFALFVGITAVTPLALLAVQLAGVAFVPALGPGFSITNFVVYMLAIAVVMLAVTAASQGATIVAISHVYLGRPITVTAALERIKGRIVSLSITMIVVGLLMTLGLLLLVVPGIILALMWALVIPVAVLEDRSMLDAASRSADLTKDDRLRALVIYILFIIIAVIVSMIIEVPLAIVGLVSSGFNAAAPMALWLQITRALASFLTQCLVAPLMTIAFSLLYYDQRVRKEAFDLELMMAAIDGQSAPDQLPPLA